MVGGMASIESFLCVDCTYIVWKHVVSFAPRETRDLYQI